MTTNGYLCLFDHPKYCGELNKAIERGTFLGAAFSTALWESGCTLKVYFFDGSKSLQEKIALDATEWSQYANIKFDFGKHERDAAEIRISFSFQAGKSWSYLGKFAQKIPKDEPTMNFGWLTDVSSEEEIKKVVLHEFGHALGLVHEHQHPRSKIQWNKANIEKAFANLPPNNSGPSLILNAIFSSNMTTELLNLYPLITSQ